ncbi:unnamed protein product [Spirodela intermedia]|uniref:Uncharacterized protein n=1 Tax=Spirodela intermedia TaxID=51605 RepID=A0A7I8ILR2_SPIIN|nr:unnamed protein product [Spirodela intermedia]CAA6658459.1 unnamed protein product [Spirodela intermedia]
MEGSSCVGLVAVMAVSGSVALVTAQLHRRLSSEFMKKVKFELELLHEREEAKKVRFADDVAEPSSNNEEYRRRRSAGGAFFNPAISH